VAGVKADAPVDAGAADACAAELFWPAPDPATIFDHGLVGDGRRPHLVRSLSLLRSLELAVVLHAAPERPSGLGTSTLIADHTHVVILM
jgi:hypothetical protein